MELADLKSSKLWLATWLILMYRFPSVLCCEGCVYKSKVAYYNPSQAVNAGSCGYGSFASTFTSGALAMANPNIYADGGRCGACYQLRCTIPEICSKHGVKVVVTDLSKTNETDFVIPISNFSSLAQPGKSSQLVKMSMVDIEYKRIPCEYPGKNLTVKVDKSSRYPSYLALQFLYQGGQTDIMSVNVVGFGELAWKEMPSRRGNMWSLENPPKGPLSMRALVTSGFDGYWVWLKRNVLPADWKADGVYDGGVKVTQVALGACYPCDQEEWKDVN